MSPVVFPIAFDDLNARMEFRELTGHRLSENGIEVNAISVRHPGGALGFRLSPPNAPSRSVVFIPDNELDRFGDQAPGAPTKSELIRFAHGARVLIHDAMYTGAEYMDHRGWGHSSYRDAIDFAIAAEVHTLVLFHHDPERSDAALGCAAPAVPGDGARAERAGSRLLLQLRGWKSRSELKLVAGCWLLVIVLVACACAGPAPATSTRTSNQQPATSFQFTFPHPPPPGVITVTTSPGLSSMRHLAGIG
jgi:hypothetical protein